MHLVYAIDHLHSGGAQRQAVELAVRMRREADLRVSVLVYRSEDFYADRLQQAGIPIVVVPKNSKYDPRLPLRIRRWLIENSADVIHAFLPWPSMWCYLAVRSLRRNERPVFISAERSSLIATHPGETLMQRILYRGSDAVTVNAESVGEQIHLELGVSREKIHYLPNGIDLDAWDRSAAEDPPFELQPEYFHLALVGGLRREKNHKLVLAALAQLGSKRTRDWRVWFIGLEHEGGKVAREIRAEIASFGLSGVVRIKEPTTRIAAVIARLDGMLLPSDFEGFPNVVLEAMASRVPTIATAVGDIPNMIDDGVTGFVLPRLGVDCIAGAMQRLREMPADARAAVGARARVVVEERYSMSKIGRHHLELYRALATARSS